MKNKYSKPELKLMRSVKQYSLCDICQVSNQSVTFYGKQTTESLVSDASRAKGYAHSSCVNKARKAIK